MASNPQTGAGESPSRDAPIVTFGFDVLDRIDGYQTMGLDRLIAMKLTAFRDKDRTHLRDMIDVGLIDQATPAWLPESLRPRLEQLLANPDG
ncbi:MAG: nucleotidyl transferase AbiEii/AbiGii toxin family protein [Planctomycetota bacterium]